MFLRRVLIIFFLCVLFFSVIGYGTYRALPVFMGPNIEIDNPQDGEEVEGTSISIRGTVVRAKTLYINNIPTAFNESGVFESRLAVYPGSNIVILEVFDRFGRKKTIDLNIGTR